MFRRLVRFHARADSRLVPSQWETLLQSKAVSHWLGANLESALHVIGSITTLQTLVICWTYWLYNSRIHGLLNNMVGSIPTVIVNISASQFKLVECLSQWMSQTLTHWGWDKIATNSLRTFSNAFPWMKIYKLRLRFHWSLFPRVQFIMFQHWFRLWLGAEQAPSHYLNQWWLVYWWIYALLGLNELMAQLQNCPSLCLQMP